MKQRDPEVFPGLAVGWRQLQGLPEGVLRTGQVADAAERMAQVVPGLGVAGFELRGPAKRCNCLICCLMFSIVLGR